MGAAAGSEKPRILQLYTVKDRKGGYLLTRIFFLFCRFFFLLWIVRRSSLHHELLGALSVNAQQLSNQTILPLWGLFPNKPRPASKVRFVSNSYLASCCYCSFLFSLPPCQMCQLSPAWAKAENCRS